MARDDELQKALDLFEEHGWYVDSVNPNTGYTCLKCGCGDHIGWLPKTPSNRNTYARKAGKKTRECSTKDQVSGSDA